MKKASANAKTRNGKREIYTWIKENKFEELMKIAEEREMTIAAIAREAILEYMRKAKRTIAC